MTGDPIRRAGDEAEPGLAVVYQLPTGRSQVAESGAGSSVVVADLGSAVAPSESATMNSDVIFDDDDDEGGGGDDGGRDDWAWVREWRDGHEPTPWATGVPLAVFSALLVAVAIWVLSDGLSDRPVVAVLVNLLVAGGLTPAIWLSRNLPVLRWIAIGAAAGIALGWISAILMLPLPSP